jgi:hypothetical protein
METVSSDVRTSRAETCCTTAVEVPRVQKLPASPLASVVVSVEERVPSPDVTAKTTAAEATGCPWGSVTWTRNGDGRG